MSSLPVAGMPDGNQLPVMQAPLPTQPSASTNSALPSMLEHMINRLTGTGGEDRYQLWPEKVVRDALSAAHDAYNSKEPLTSQDLIKPAMDMGALAGTGGLAGTSKNVLPEVADGLVRIYHGGENPTSGGSRWVTMDPIYAKNYGIGNKEVHYADVSMSDVMEHGGYDEINNRFRHFQLPENLAKTLKNIDPNDFTLGSAPFLRPALKYEGKIYKAPMGGQHLDAIPAEVYPKFQQMAMNGEDINHFNFGFMNHKGQFLDREKALDYAIKEGLLDPHSAQYGALTSTMETQ